MEPLKTIMRRLLDLLWAGRISWGEFDRRSKEAADRQMALSLGVGAAMPEIKEARRVA